MKRRALLGVASLLAIIGVFTFVWLTGAPQQGPPRESPRQAEAGPGEHDLDDERTCVEVLESDGRLIGAIRMRRRTELAYLEDLATRATDYAGFNLLVGDHDSLWYFSNGDQSPPRNLPPGIYGLSNAMLDTPWPKIELGKARLGELLDEAKRPDDGVTRQGREQGPEQGREES